MKIWILVFSTALFVGGTCLGVALQPKLVPAAKTEAKIDPARPDAPSWAGRHVREFSPTRFASELDLSAEQDRELDAIMSDGQEETQALGRAMKASQDKTRERIVAILSPEQKTKLDALMAAERQKRADADINRSVASYTKILGLSDEQSQVLKTALTESRSRRHEIKRGEDYQQARKSIREAQNRKLEESFGADKYKKYLEVSELDRSDR
jgi:Spy/CpxP family protein refolding chaperone